MTGRLSLPLGLLAFLIAGGGWLLFYYWVPKWGERLVAREEGLEAVFMVLLLIFLGSVWVLVVGGVAVTGLVLGVVSLAACRRERQCLPLADSLGALLNLLVLVMMVVFFAFAF